MSAATEDNLMQTNWIENRPIEAHGGHEVAVVNPATEEVIDTIPRGSAADTDAAIAAARRAQPAWAARSPVERRTLLRVVAERML